MTQINLIKPHNKNGKHKMQINKNITKHQLVHVADA